jgi:hypothetical protein
MLSGRARLALRSTAGPSLDEGDSMTPSGNITPLLDHLLDVAKKTTDPLMFQWETRKDIAKTLISLASATLVFTITFSSSLTAKGASSFWRYTILFCWLTFVASLILALASLWCSMGLANLQALVLAKTPELREAAKETFSKPYPDSDPVYSVFQEASQEVVRDDRRSRRLLQAAMTCFGVALVILTALGVRQLIF